MNPSRRASVVLLVLAVAFALCSSAGFAQGFKQIHQCGFPDEQPNTMIQNPADGDFYGTSRGGNGLGSVWKMDTSGNVAVIHSFAGGPDDGKFPQAGLYLNSADGLLYGTAYTGGAYGGGDVGGVFQLNSSGSSYSFHSQPLDPLGYCTTTGTSPIASFFKANDGSFYVPMNLCGGGSFAGVIDRIDTSLSETQIAGFDPTVNGYEYPAGHLVQGSDDKLYGLSMMSQPFGSNGGIYRVGLGGGSIESVHVFGNGEGSVGDVPAPLLLASDGNFYGTTFGATDSMGDGLSTGTIFRIGTDGTFATLHNFSWPIGPDGSTPYAGLMQASDGYLYGTTSTGGRSAAGVLYRIDLAGNYKFLLDFADTDSGSFQPYTELVQGTDGKLYGTTGALGVGTIYTIDLTQTIASITPDSGPGAGGTNVTIAGSGFVSGATVVIESPLQNVTVPDATHMSGTTSLADAGTIQNVKVTLPDTTVIMMYGAWMYDFLDVPTGDVFHEFVRKLLANKVTTGCGGGNFCRDASVTRAQMAVFLLKGEHGSDYVPPACTGIFFDVPCSNPFADWIEQLSHEGITGGCGNGNYCPGSPVLRQQMAVFLLKAEHGSGFAPPACQGAFLDVPCPSPFADWIEDLAAEMITGGCGGGNFCPGNSVNRGQMAVFLVKTFHLQ